MSPAPLQHQDTGPALFRRHIHLRFTDASSHKEYRLEARPDGDTIHVDGHYGRIGQGFPQHHHIGSFRFPDDVATAAAEYDTVLLDKLKKGYRPALGPNVPVTLFSTGAAFRRRIGALARKASCHAVVLLLLRDATPQQWAELTSTDLLPLFSSPEAEVRQTALQWIDRCRPDDAPRPERPSPARQVRAARRAGPSRPG